MSIDLTISLPFWFATALAAAMLPVLRRAKIAMPPRALFLMAVLLLLAAAARPTLVLSRPPNVVVMIDCSSSTRSADFRHRLDARLTELMPGPPAQRVYFAQDHSRIAPERPEDDLPGDRTVFSPPDADAVLLFSDGQFDLPAAAPPVYAVLDEGLRLARDARIGRMAPRGEFVDVTTESSFSGSSLQIGDGAVVAVPQGTRTFSAPVDAPGTITASLSPDQWPENNTKTLALPVPGDRRWWFGPGAPATFRAIDGRMPIDAGSMTAVSAVVLNDVAATAVHATTMSSLERYVRELGGTLILNGGRNALAAGGWTGTPVDAVSPLAASPPSPQRLWVILIDASGSMAAQTPAGTRFDSAVAAARAAVERLPPSDRAVVGTFAEELSWLVRDPIDVRALRDRELAPRSPRGSTNLNAALRSIADGQAGLPRELLIISDGETAGALTIGGAELVAAGIRPSLLLLGPRERATGLLAVVENAGGTIVQAGDEVHWNSGARELARIRQTPRMFTGPMSVAFDEPIGGTTGGITAANESWPRTGATILGKLPRRDLPAAGVWQLGSGRVLAFAVQVPRRLLEQVAARLSAATHDPRFQLRLEQETTDAVELTAVERGSPMNALELTIREAAGRPIAMQLVAPGMYRAEIGRERTPRILDIQLSGRTIERIAVPGRYPAEFDAIGLNAERLRQLAARSGGVVIDVADTSPIRFPAKTRRMPIGTWLSAAAACAIAAGLLLQGRLGG